MAEIPEVNTTENAMISMGKCVDCGNDWGMLPDEKIWWDEMVASRKWTLPHRCRPCRDKVRERIRGVKKGPPTIVDIIEKLEEMSMTAINDDFDEKGDQLAQKLADLASELKPYRNARPQ